MFKRNLSPSLKNILPIHLSKEAENLFQCTIPYLDKIHSTRAMAFIIKGLYYQNKRDNLYLLQTIANKLVQMYRHEKSIEWYWYESYLTYGNSLLPEAMLCAFIRTQELEYRNLAIESFHFLLSKIFIDGEINIFENKK